ncbi:cell division protein ZapE [Prescottella subtropica]|uniref:cell division protein ZapE n=1 Tax=Prescottella subtropica TaxID=2545757 RepID=UPI0010F9C247|nr:cell division protein ZapE [Prescottella subtropica]
MRWSRKTPPQQSGRSVDPAVFDTAAAELGFVLDASQRHAAAVLAAGDRDLYLWGPVGRGKSWLMATYFDALPDGRKLRVHFHEFFRDLHAAIRASRNDLGVALDRILDGLDVVCFDEFHVYDPADGKFIARLLPVLVKREIRVVLTSNYPPRSLMPNPLFHDGFVPTIDLIERSLTVVTLDGPVDYRTVAAHDSGFAAGFWVSPGTPGQLTRLGLHVPTPTECRTLRPAGHPVHVHRAADHLWIDFADLCERATAPADYLVLARDFPRWVVSGVPELRYVKRDAAQRFANVIDVLYDRDVTVIFLAHASLDTLGGDRAGLPVDIDRTCSRLGRLRWIDLAAVRS